LILVPGCQGLLQAEQSLELEAVSLGSCGRVLVFYGKGNMPATKCLELFKKLPREGMQWMLVTYWVGWRWNPNPNGVGVKEKEGGSMGCSSDICHVRVYHS